MMTTGTLKVEKCTSHVHVEWNFNIDVARWEWEDNDSPLFEIENQSYSLSYDTHMFRDYFALTLNREGPPVGRTFSIRCWVGLKRSDGSYDHKQSFRVVSPKKEYYDLLCCKDFQFSKYFDESRKFFNITVCCQVQAEEGSAGTETCTHDSAERMFPPSDGQFYEKECSCLKHVEWTLDFDWNRDSWLSSVFETGNQRFRFVFSWLKAGGILELYRLGPSVDDSLLCWAGLKRCDGTYHHENETHKFFVKDEHKAWTLPLNLMHVSSGRIHTYHLDRNKRLSFFLLINKETGAEPCTFGRPEEFPRGVGSIQKELLSPYMLVRWTFTIGEIREVSSPVCVVDNQNYLLSFAADPRPNCFVSRMGPFAGRNLRCLTVLRRSDDIYEDLGCEWGMLDLRKTADLWSRTIMHICHEPLGENWKEFTIDFLLTCDESPAARTLYFSTLSQVDGDLMNSPERDPSSVVFKVEDTAFKMNKALILILVPVFRTMLTNECVEKKTGVVTIKDCKPDVFKEFLELVEVGFKRRPSAKNALALYEVANKYLLCQFKAQCSKVIKLNLSMDNFCDVLGRCFAYEDNDLLAFAGGFLSLNKEIIESVSFNDVYSKYPDNVNKLLRTLFPTMNYDSGSRILS